MNQNLDFQPGQILYLEYEQKRLYTELIQVVRERQLFWVRPLLLADFAQEPTLVTDLRSSSDLLWSANFFQPALDVEVVSFFTNVLAKESELGVEVTAKKQLNGFIQQLWSNLY
ncbi:MAG: hypothetical protein IGS39_02935 [Calothrix sp. C42_A2020_038]|nr:hypothetical protein [Calothrix sp. C42_A2020_038]